MPETCGNDQDCPMGSRIAVLERAGEQHGSTHREMFDRLRALETSDAVQNAHYKVIDTKLDELTVMVRELFGKSGRRWDSMVEKALWAVVAAGIAYVLARVGL